MTGSNHFFTLLSAFLLLLQTGYSQTSFTGKPRYDIEAKRNNVSLGTIQVELFPNIAPLHAKNFDSLVSTQFFDSTAFHRVIPSFMIQGGDPNSKHGPRSTWGYGDPDQPTVNAEFSAARHVRGTLSAARDTSVNSANSQFFICVAPASWLNGQYSVYGKVVSGMNIVDTIVSAPRDSVDNPFQKIEMFVSYSGSNDTIPQAPTLNSPLSGTLVTSTSKQLKWNAVSDAIIYHLEVSTDSLFSTLFKSVEVATTYNQVSGLTFGNKYYWRVTANNGGHNSIYSDTWNFVASGVGIEDVDHSIPQITVYPNPSSGLFQFRGLTKNNMIKVYDVTGRLILEKIIENSLEEINLSDKPKGVYFYSVINSRGDIASGKLICIY